MSLILSIESWKEKSGKAFGGILYGISKNLNYLKELNTLTDFLNSVYPVVSLQQRFYHVWFDHYKIEECPYCSLPRMFSKKSKFSIDRYGIGPTNPVNYYATCMSAECQKKYNTESSKKGLFKKHGVDNQWDIPGYRENLENSNISKYGSKYYAGTEVFKEKVKKTFDLKYGGHPTKLESTQEKKRKTNTEKYGFSHSLDNPVVKEKSKRTNQLKYGGNSSMCSDVTKDKSKETNRKKWGNDWYVQSDDFKMKFKETMLSRYGVDQVMHYTPHFEKSLDTSYKKKIFVFPSGRIEKIQGYEGFGISDLLISGYMEEDIIISNSEIEEYTGKIWYDYKNKIRKYYPDIYLISGHKIVEIKSKYTYETHIVVNKRKKNACLNLGLNFEFWIYDEKGNKMVK
jgi:hypothetical protein